MLLTGWRGVMPYKKQEKLTCFDVADYFLSLADEDEGDYITNLKLQKLLYYAQGLHLACYDTPLFDECIEAWAHGPVIPEVYFKYRNASYDVIPKPQNIDFSIFDEETREFLNEVYQIFGQYSAWKLREMTHEEPPWQQANKRGVNTIISHEPLKDYFSQYVEEGEGEGED